MLTDIVLDAGAPCPRFLRYSWWEALHTGLYRVELARLQAAKDEAKKALAESSRTSCPMETPHIVVVVGKDESNHEFLWVTLSLAVESLS
jgi:hypothetical protein